MVSKHCACNRPTGRLCVIGSLLFVLVWTVSLTAATGEDPETAPQDAAPDSLTPSQGSFALGPGDLLAIDVFALDELDSKVRVLQDGTITIPLLGNIPIAGLTVKQAERKIAHLLAERRLANDPQVSISVEEFVSLSVSIQGAVNGPGRYPILGNNTLLEMIGQAGGFAGDHGRWIVVLRQTAAGDEPRIEIDLRRLVNGGDLSLNIPLRPGDIVMVPRARTVRVYLAGAVQRTGALQYSSADGITILQAITAAGGPTERASLSKVYITRRLPDGTQQRIKVDVKKIKSGKQKDLLLQENDIVFVGQSFF